MAVQHPVPSFLSSSEVYFGSRDIKFSNCKTFTIFVKGASKGNGRMPKHQTLVILGS